MIQMKIVEMRKVKKTAKILTAIGIGTAYVLLPGYRYYILGSLIAKNIILHKVENKIITVKRRIKY
jgi:hypothetical protein